MILLDHIALNAIDVEETVNFYRDLLAVPVDRWQQFVDGEVKFPSLRLSETLIIDVFPPSMWQAPEQAASTVFVPNLSHFCLTVSPEQWQQIAKRASSQNIEIIKGPGTYWGAQGNGTSIYFKDPAGNIVEIRKYPASVDEAS